MLLNIVFLKDLGVGTIKFEIYMKTYSAWWSQQFKCMGFRNKCFLTDISPCIQCIYIYAVYMRRIYAVYIRQIYTPPRPARPSSAVLGAAAVEASGLGQRPRGICGRFSGQRPGAERGGQGNATLRYHYIESASVGKVLNGVDRHEAHKNINSSV